MDELFRAAADAGIRIEYCHIPLNTSMSMEDENGDFVLMDYSLIYAGAKERTHLAHEIGHCVNGAFYNPYAALDIRQKHENRADKWAILRLIPQDELEDAVAAGHTEIWDLAEFFGVTEEFMKKAVCYYSCGNLAANLCF